jgi:hypothetical protein
MFHVKHHGERRRDLPHGLDQHRPDVFRLESADERSGFLSVYWKKLGNSGFYPVYWIKIRNFESCMLYETKYVNTLGLKKTPPQVPFF